MLYPPILPLKL